MSHLQWTRTKNNRLIRVDLSNSIASLSITKNKEMITEKVEEEEEDTTLSANKKRKGKGNGNGNGNETWPQYSIDAILSTIAIISWSLIIIVNLCK